MLTPNMRVMSLLRKPLQAIVFRSAKFITDVDVAHAVVSQAFTLGHLCQLPLLPDHQAQLQPVLAFAVAWQTLH